MANFGNYETAEQLASSGPFTLYKARGGAAGDVAVKVYESQAAFIGDLWDRKAESFVQSALLVKTLTERGAKRWNPVFDAAKTEDYAFYAATLRPLNVPRFISGVRRTSAREIGTIVAGIASGLIELRDMMSGRGHGRLNAGAVLLSGGADGGPGDVYLCDALGPNEAGPQSAIDDKIALGKLIFEMVMRREAPNSGGFAMTAEWSALGAGGKMLFELSEALYAGAQCALTLEQIRDRALALPAPSSGSKGVVIAGVAAVLVLGAGGALFALRAGSKGETKKEEIITQTVAEITGPCITLGSGATEWTCDIITKADCDTKQGRYLGDGKPAVRFLVDPREREDWPPALSEADLEKWKTLEKRAALLPETTDQYRKLFRDALDDLKAALARVNDDPRWVPRPEDPSYGDPTLSIGLQQKTVDEATRIRAEFESFRIDGPRMKGLVAEIDRLTTGNISPLIEKVTGILAESERQLEKLRADFDAQMFKDAGYDPSLFDFAAVRNELQALQVPDPAGAPLDPRKRDDALEAASTLKYRVEEIDVTLGTLVAEKIRDASRTLSDDLPVSLRDAFKAQIEKLAGSTLGASEKYARAKAAKFWASKITDSFAIEGLASLDGVFDAATFERIKGEKAARAVNEFAAVVAALDVFPAQDDAQFQSRLSNASGELGAWRDKARNLGVRAVKIKTMLADAFAPDEQVDGESVDSILQSMRASPEWSELKDAFKPLSDLEASLNAIARDNLSPDALIAVVRDRSLNPAIAPSGKRIAWRRLSSRGDWPATVENLRELPAIGAELATALRNAGVDASRITVIVRDEVERSLAARWLTFVNEKIGADAAIIESLYAPETRRAFFVTGETPEGLNDKARFNFDLMKARAEAVALTDADIPAFIARWESKLSSDERIARAIAMWKAGKFATDWKQAGPGLAGWKVQNEESEDHVVYTKQYKGATYTLRFNKVGESSMVCTTEFTIGLAAMLLGESGAPYNLFFARQLKDGGVGVSPWYSSNGSSFDLRRPSQNPALRNEGWLPEVQALSGSQLFAQDINPPEFDTPVNFISASGAISMAQALGCRLPSSSEWQAAGQLVDGAVPNLRDGTFARQLQHAAALPITNTAVHFPSQGRFPTEDPARAVDPRSDSSAVSGDDGFVYFRPVVPGSAAFLDVKGNVAEWVVSSRERELDVSAPQPLTADQRNKASASVKDVVGVIGASAMSPPEADPSRFVPANAIAGFSAVRADRYSYSDVGFRLAFTAEGGGGGSGKPSETVRRRLAGVLYR